MSFVLLSDLHLTDRQYQCRIDDITETQFNKLEFVYDYAEKNKIKNILIAGDVFDKPRSWYLLPLFIDFLKKYQTIKTYVISGQHDLFCRSTAKGGTNLGILEKIGLITILNNKPTKFNGINLFGCSWEEEPPKIKKSSNKNVLVIHAPIGIVPVFPGHKNIDAIQFLKKYKYFDLVLCGDIHQRFHEHLKNRYILNAGCMLRKTADEYNFKHKPGFFTCNNELNNIQWIEIPHKKGSDVLTRIHLEKENQKNILLEKFINNIQYSEVKTIKIIKNIYVFYKKNKIHRRIQSIIADEMEKTE